MGKDLRTTLFFQGRRGVIKACVAIIIVCGSVASSISQTPSPVAFEDFLYKRFSGGSPAWDRERFCPGSTSVVARRVLEAYGAVFAANESVMVPKVCIFRGESEVIAYQKSLQTRRVDLSGVGIDLQTAATDALGRSITEAEALGFRISPFDGAIAGSRSYGQTLMLWNSRFVPALEFWVEQGRLSPAERDEIGGLDLDKKLERVLEWESRGIYFSTTRTRSILTSTAPPGSSQHLMFLALDISEFSNPAVRQILNQNGWYQTVIDDPPHFTYLGIPESHLPGRGLRVVYKGSYQYWVPNLSAPSINDATN
jgi:hypothetical protein